MPDDNTPDDNTPADDTKPDEVTPPEGDADAKPDADADADKPKLSLDDALSEVTKTRAEAANYRTRAREAEKKLAEAKSLEEVEQIIASMTAERETAERTLLAENVALTHKLPPALAARLQGNTREELEADAKSLAEFFASEEDDDVSSRRPKGGLDPHDTDDNEPSDPRELARSIPR